MSVLIVFTWIGHPSLGDNLVDENAKRPDVRLDGELAEVDGLRGSPFDGHLGT